MSETINVDYLVVGAGAMGLAFVDTLLSDTNKTIAIVDRYARPGGHWTMAYPFVRLHQPAAFYGVNSRPLGNSDRLDQYGWNEGLPELSSRDEILSYFDLVMRETFIPSGRVQYFPKHEYQEGKFSSILTGKTYEVSKDAIIVDATYSETKVPSMAPPAYEVAEGVNLVTPNDLPLVKRGYANYTVVGCGKTGIDSVLWLLESGIPQKDITWIMPRDAYFFNRNVMQPGKQFMETGQKAMLSSNEKIMTAKSVDEVLQIQVEAGQLNILDEKVKPTMWHCATISQKELEAIRKVDSIIRQGRVTRITPEEVTLTKGSYKPVPDTLFVDCSASAVAKKTPLRVFQGKKIVLQPVRHCQQTFGAAVIAHVEASYDDEALKNTLCNPIPMPNTPIDQARIMVQSNTNALQWARNPKTQAFVDASRLNIWKSFIPPPPEEPKAQAAYYAQMLGGLEAVTKKLTDLMEALPEPDAARMRAELNPW